VKILGISAFYHDSAAALYANLKAKLHDRADANTSAR